MSGLSDDPFNYRKKGSLRKAPDIPAISPKEVTPFTVFQRSPGSVGAASFSRLPLPVFTLRPAGLPAIKSVEHYPCYVVIDRDHPLRFFELIAAV